MKTGAASIAFMGSGGRPGGRGFSILAFVAMDPHKRRMPTLTRITVFLVLAAAVVYGAMFALAHFVAPDQREISIEIPPAQLKPVPVAPQTAGEQ